MVNLIVKIILLTSLFAVGAFFFIKYRKRGEKKDLMLGIFFICLHVIDCLSFLRKFLVHSKFKSFFLVIECFLIVGTFAFMIASMKKYRLLFLFLLGVVAIGGFYGYRYTILD